MTPRHCPVPFSDASEPFYISMVKYSGIVHAEKLARFETLQYVSRENKENTNLHVYKKDIRGF